MDLPVNHFIFDKAHNYFGSIHTLRHFNYINMMPFYFLSNLLMCERKNTNWNNNNSTQSIDQLIAKRPHTIEWIHFFFWFHLIFHFLFLFDFSFISKRFIQIRNNIHYSHTLKKRIEITNVHTLVCRLNHQRLKCCKFRCLSCIISVFFIVCLFVGEANQVILSKTKQKRKCLLKWSFYLIFRLKAPKFNCN